MNPCNVCERDADHSVRKDTQGGLVAISLCDDCFASYSEALDATESLLLFSVAKYGAKASLVPRAVHKIVKFLADIECDEKEAVEELRSSCWINLWHALGQAPGLFLGISNEFARNYAEGKAEKGLTAPDPQE